MVIKTLSSVNRKKIVENWKILDFFSDKFISYKKDCFIVRECNAFKKFWNFFIFILSNLNFTEFFYFINHFFLVTTVFKTLLILNFWN